MTKAQRTLGNRWTGLSQNARGFSFIGVGAILLAVAFGAAQLVHPSSSSEVVNAGGSSGMVAPISTSTSTTWQAVSTSSSASITTTLTLYTTTVSVVPSTAAPSLVSDPSSLSSGWFARLGSSQPGVPREVSDITNLLAQVRSIYPNAAVFSTDALGSRSSLRSGYLVLLIGSYPDRASASAVCSQLPSNMKPYGCDVDHIS